MNVIERTCAEAITRANQRIYKQLTDWLTDVHRQRLDELLGRKEGSTLTLLAGLRVYASGDWPTDKVFEGISHPPKLENPRSVLGRSPLLGSRSKK